MASIAMQLPTPSAFYRARGGWRTTRSLPLPCAHIADAAALLPLSSRLVQQDVLHVLHADDAVTPCASDQHRPADRLMAGHTQQPQAAPEQCMCQDPAAAADDRELQGRHSQAHTLSTPASSSAAAPPGTALTSHHARPQHKPPVPCSTSVTVPWGQPLQPRGLLGQAGLGTVPGAFAEHRAAAAPAWLEALAAERAAAAESLQPPAAHAAPGSSSMHAAQPHAAPGSTPPPAGTKLTKGQKKLLVKKKRKRQAAAARDAASAATNSKTEQGGSEPCPQPAEEAPPSACPPPNPAASLHAPDPAPAPASAPAPSAPAPAPAHAPNAEDDARERYLMSLIMGASSWQELSVFLLQHRSCMNHIHVSAMLVRLTDMQGRGAVSSAAAYLQQLQQEQQQQQQQQQQWQQPFYGDETLERWHQPVHGDEMEEELEAELELQPELGGWEAAAGVDWEPEQHGHQQSWSQQQPLQHQHAGEGSLASGSGGEPHASGNTPLSRGGGGDSMDPVLEAGQRCYDSPPHPGEPYPPQREPVTLARPLHPSLAASPEPSQGPETDGRTPLASPPPPSPPGAASTHAPQQRPLQVPGQQVPAELLFLASRRFPTLQRLAAALAKEAVSKLRAMGMWEVSGSLRAIVTLCPPDKPTVVRFMTRAWYLMKRKEEVTAEGLATLIWAVAKSGMQGLRADWAARFFAAAEAKAGELTAQGAAMLLYSLARLQTMPPAPLRQALLERLAALAEAGATRPQDVSMTMWALARLRTQPPPGLGERLLLATQAQLPLFSAQELSVTIWGLAKLRSQPPKAWCTAFYSSASVSLLHDRQPRARVGPYGPPPGTDVGTGQAVSITLYALALLQLRPEEQWLVSCLKHVARHSNSFTQQGLTCVVYAVAMMGYRPGREWLVRCHRVLESFPEPMHPASQTMLSRAYELLQHNPADRSDAAGGGRQQLPQRQQRLGQGADSRVLPGEALRPSAARAPAAAAAGLGRRMEGLREHRADPKPSVVSPRQLSTLDA